MTSRQITLPDDIETFIDGQVKSGAYANASELLADAVRRLEQDVENEPDTETLRGLVQDSLNDPRPSVPAKEVWRRLDDQARRRTP